VPSSYAGIASSLQIPEDPKSFTTAMRSPKVDQWRAAMQAKYNSLMQTGTWKLVHLPPGRKPVKCKWIYRVKTNSDGTVARFKARLVAQGCTQMYGVDYDQTFSPVVKYDSIRTTLAIAAHQKMHLMQFDIQTSFLHGLINTVIYMLQPPRFEVVDQDGIVLVCLIFKSLYGFKQSGRIWNQTFDRFLLKFELAPTKADQYVYISKSDPPLIVALFVDDGQACCASESKLAKLIKYMEDHFSIIQSSADLYVGLHIYQDKANQRIYINQSVYLRRILARFGFENYTPLSTPADPNTKLDDTKESFEPPFTYLVAVGCLLFAQMLSRPDISFAVSVVAQFSANPQRSHFAAVTRIYRYIVGTLDLALCFDGNNGPPLLEAYADIDYAGDLTDWKSCTETLLLVSNVPVAWYSWK
jgi:hypothetical protein